MSKWIKGMLCQDLNSVGRRIRFFPETTRGQVKLKDASYMGLKKGHWIKIWKATPHPFLWKRSEWLKSYYAKDVPKKGKCMEVVLEI